MSVAEGDRISVTPPELVEAARAIRALLSNLSSGFNALDADVNKLMASWQGKQGTLFANGWTDIQRGLDELLDAIADTTVALDASSEAYLAQEQANVDAIVAVRSSLDLS